jgi:hypothetical protein
VRGLFWAGGGSGRAEGRKRGGSAAARGRTLLRASRARAVRAPGAAGQVGRRFQPLRRKEAAQEGPASPGRVGGGVENHEAGGCARAGVAAGGRACGRARGRSTLPRSRRQQLLVRRAARRRRRRARRRPITTRWTLVGAGIACPVGGGSNKRHGRCKGVRC